MSSSTSSKLNLDQLSKEELIDHIKKQNAHIKQLRKVISKKNNPSVKKNPEVREFDFSKYGKKHIALKFLYLGWNYDGYVEQENTENTIEDHLFEALLKSRLIESRQTSNYHRCGRTDKGVSAFSQVISLDLRSKLSTNGEEEVKYCKLLNKVLPKDIRAICSAEVDQEFSARFDCRSRTYKYYFPIGSLNVELMEKAASYLIGTHDFRNFSKLDKTKIETNSERKMESVKLIKCVNYSKLDDYRTSQDIYELEIKSSAFLWHQIRNIVAILFCIGNGNEKPELVKDLLDLDKFKKKPQYYMAKELPLVLFDCEYDFNNWEYDQEALKDAINPLNELWIENTIQNVIISKMLNNLNQFRANDDEFQKFFIKELTMKNYKMIEDRPTCDMMNDKLKNKIEKRKKHKLIDKSLAEESKKIKLDEE